MTDHGRRVHRKWWDKIFDGYPNPPSYEPLKEDAEGFHENQLWCVIEIFGPCMRISGPLPFETEIYLQAGKAEKDHGE